MWRQLFQCIESRIHEALLQPGEALPSVRGLARAAGVSADTVKKAYAELAAAGFVRAAPRSGYFVAAQEGEASRIRQRTPERASVLHALTPRAAYAAQVFRQNVTNRTPNKPFAPYAPAMSAVLDREWIKIASNEARAPWRNAYYSTPGGLASLKFAIRENLRRYDGIAVEPEQIIITSGMVQNLALCADVLFEPGDAVWSEAPLTESLADVLPFRGIDLKPVPVDEAGLQVDWAISRFPEAKGVLLTPDAQMPMSVRLDEERRRRLIEWARTRRFYILEDATERHITLEGAPPASFMNRPGAAGHAIYLTSFSLMFFPDIKLGFMVVPEVLADAFAGAKLLTDRSTSERNQEILARFIESDFYDLYRRKIIRHYRESFLTLKTAALAHLGPYGHLSPTRSGIHAVFHLRPEISDAAVSAALAERGIVARPVSGFRNACPEHNGLLLGFGGFSKKAIIEGVAVIASVCKAALEGKQSPSRRS